MSFRRSRHSPTTRTSQSNRVTKDGIPRYTPSMAQPTIVDAAFDDMQMKHFSLNTYCGPPTTGYDIANWLESDQSLNPEDDYPLTSSPLSAHHMVNPDDSMSYRSIMLPSQDLHMQPGFDSGSPAVYSRHAPLDEDLLCGTKQLSSLSVNPDNLTMNPLPLELRQYASSTFEDISQAYCNSTFSQQETWAYGMPSPPLTHSSYTSDETRYTSELALTPSTGMSSLHGRHSPPNVGIQDMSPCELPSPLQPFCGPSIMASRPRPLRSALEKKECLQEVVHSPEENTKPRDNPYYGAGPDESGFFRCPFYETEKCQHQPTKQKCIYAKYLDSHLKPYRCRVQKPECQEKVFSSNACLFRHEREAHGFHGHGENPNLCWVPGCERSKLGNGFPRKWNLGDHMKRVHSINMSELEDHTIGSTERHNSNPSLRKRKGTNAPASVPMKRSGTSYAKTQVTSAPYSKDARHAVNNSRPAPQVNYSNPTRTGGSTNFPESYPIPAENVQYSTYSQSTRYAPGYSGQTYYPISYTY